MCLGLFGRAVFEADVNGLVHQLPQVVGAIGELVLDPRPALADGVEDHLRAGAVRDIGRRQVDHQQPAVGVDHHVPLAAHRLLAGVVAAAGDRRRRFHGLARLAPGSLAVHHQRDIVDHLEQHQP